MTPDVEKIIQWAQGAGQILREGYGKRHTINHKGRVDLVTEADRRSEAYLIEKIRGQFPTHTIFSEESGNMIGSDGACWFIDPLDGTTNYVHNDTPYSVSIALMKEREILLGVVFDPVAEELYYAVENENARLNQKPIKVSEKNMLQNGYIGFGIPYNLTAEGEKILQNALHQFKKCSFRIKGSAAIEICYVACGRSDAYFHSALSPWDVAAASFILKCAGGRCTDFSDGDNYIFGKEIVASNGYLHQELMNEIIRKQ